MSNTNLGRVGGVLNRRAGAEQVGITICYKRVSKVKRKHVFFSSKGGQVNSLSSTRPTLGQNFFSSRYGSGYAAFSRE